MWFTQLRLYAGSDHYIHFLKGHTYSIPFLRNTPSLKSNNVFPGTKNEAFELNDIDLVERPALENGSTEANSGGVNINAHTDATYMKDPDVNKDDGNKQLNVNIDSVQ